ncbi:MAG: elongation factor P [Myxococcales bacterium FL481]|nr:MAG: elongation factor P [Myxococcales bacterium FL481]
MDVSDLKKNAKIRIDGHPYVVVDFQFVKPGKGQGLYKCKLKNMLSGSILDRTWRSGEKLEAADVESRGMQYLFASPEGLTFMDTESYEQIELTMDLVGNDRHYLTDQLDVDVLFYEGRAVGLTLPSHVVMSVTECEPGVKGDTATGATKGATVETGYTLQVPLFIKVDERIKIDTRTGEYVERVNQ